ncbi:hypothetical protein CNY89_20600, partial [Amaricoccus sp. HAR-UPW-R2A-40]
HKDVLSQAGCLIAMQLTAAQDRAAIGAWIEGQAQRPAVLHKDVLSQAGCLIAMQLTAAQDRAAIGAWIEGQADRAEAKALLASLPQLRTGEGWLWWPHAGPPVQQRFPRIRTLDTGSTPAHGEEASDTPLSDAGLDLEALRGTPGRRSQQRFRGSEPSTPAARRLMARKPPTHRSPTQASTSRR